MEPVVRDDDREAEEAATRLRAAAAKPSGDLAVSHTTGGANLPFARNWWRHLQRAGVSNFALLATDDAAYVALERELPGRAVRCPQSIVGGATARIAAEASSARGARYRSAGWTKLMFAVPAMVRWVLRLGLNVLWMDTDVVALSNPFVPIHSQLMSESRLERLAPSRGANGRGPRDLVLASVDGRVPDEDPRECNRLYTASARWGRSAGGWKLCGGLFYLPRSDAALRFLADWESRLHGQHAGAKNQPHYNDALKAASEQRTIKVRLLPCELFPNGFRYASDGWRRAQAKPPVAVHNNWIKGHEAKLARFRTWGMWLGEEAANASTAPANGRRRGRRLREELKGDAAARMADLVLGRNATAVWASE